jgi:hypothetical protein
MEQTTDIIGYRVLFLREEQFLDFKDQRNFLTYDEPTPIPRGDALRRLAAFLDEHPEFDIGEFSIEPTYRVLQPVESGARELADLLKSLCTRHGIKLGLTDAQIEAQIGRELKAYGAL